MSEVVSPHTNFWDSRGPLPSSITLSDPLLTALMTLCTSLLFDGSRDHYLPHTSACGSFHPFLSLLSQLGAGDRRQPADGRRHHCFSGFPGLQFKQDLEGDEKSTCWARKGKSGMKNRSARCMWSLWLKQGATLPSGMQAELEGHTMASQLSLGWYFPDSQLSAQAWFL